MDLANRYNGIVIGTGDLSELALGWATYNGDHMSMYGVNASVPKTLMQHIVSWAAKNSDNGQIARTLIDIVDTPISPELTPADEKGNIKQKTEDLVGPYELHDFFLYNFVCNGFAPAKIYFLAQKAFEGTYSNDTIKKWLSTFFWRFTTQQFKRSCMPDAPATGCCSLSQGWWSMPSDASPAMLSALCKNIDKE
jgi:NAD+ synthase (glutamine-hydrolysing)